ncbi:MAG: PAM68 family protein [Thainema sp.]
MPSDSERKPLPFEPQKSRKKAESKPKDAKSATNKPTKSASAKSQAKSPAKSQSAPPARRSANQRTLDETRIPDAVGKRMIRRMAVFCGIPTALGVSTFFASYFIVVNGVFDLPNSAVVLVSMACFGLGVIGLSYGVLSASWEEETPGTLLGIGEFKINLGRMTAAWRDARKQQS